MNRGSAAFDCTEENVAQLVTKWLGERDVTDDAFTEEAAATCFGSIDQLIGQHDVTGSDLFAQRAKTLYKTSRNDTVHRTMPHQQLWQAMRIHRVQRHVFQFRHTVLDRIRMCQRQHQPLIAGIDEFKGAWRSLGTLAPDRLSALLRVATIESIGSSTRIEGSRLADREVERLLSNLQIKSFATRDEQEVAGYAGVMELIFSSWPDIALTENHIKQLHRDLLSHSEKDARHRGNYKTSTNSVVAFDENGKQLGVVFETATPFDTPRLMTELVAWFNDERAAARLHPLLLIGIPETAVDFNDVAADDPESADDVPD